jgi:site-specific DNA recombinase
MAVAAIGKRKPIASPARRSDHIRSGMRQAAGEGRVPGPARTGYLPPDLCGVSEVNPSNGLIVRNLLLGLLAGESLRSVRVSAFREGLASATGDLLSLATLHRMARDPFYAGHVRYGGKEYPGRHQPLVSVEEFNALQQVIGCPENAISFPG